MRLRWAVAIASVAAVLSVIVVLQAIAMQPKNKKPKAFLKYFQNLFGERYVQCRIYN